METRCPKCGSNRRTELWRSRAGAVVRCRDCGRQYERVVLPKPKPSFETQETLF